MAMLPDIESLSGDAQTSLVDGRYRVLDQIGSGAMGIVFRAQDVVLERIVALKLLTPTRHDDIALARFRKEARALAQVHHENVVRIFSLGDHLNAPYFAMQFVEGKTLAAIVSEYASRRESFPQARALSIIREIASGLDAVHAHSLVHRDVKPSNIVIEKRSQRPVLIDFGLARRRSASNPNLSAFAGTPLYMAPEQASDPSGSRVCARSDLYALACVAFELLTGRSVFEGENGFGLLIAHAHHPPPSVSSIRPDLRSFDAVFARALAKAPEDRHDDCEAFVDDLLRAAQRQDGVRILVLARDDDRKTIVPVLTRTLRVAGSGLEIECVSSERDLAAAFARSRADIVMIDDDAAGRRADALAQGLRYAPGGRAAEIVVIGGNRSAARLEETGARELPKPLNTHVLAVLVAQMGARIVERRVR
jgi:serine/threonine protein kinase